MALHNTWGDFNRKDESDAVVKYESDPVYYAYPDGSRRPVYWKVRRSASWSFSYLGMTRQAANACANDIRSEMTKRYLDWTAEIDSSDPSAPIVKIIDKSVVRCASDVNPVNTAGDNWSVEVSATETDVAISTKDLATVTEFEAFFQDLTGRKIFSGSLSIVSAGWYSANGGYVRARYLHNIDGFDWHDLSVERKNASGEWTRLDDGEIISRGDKSVEFELRAPGEFRIAFENVLSSSYRVKDASPAVIVLESIPEFNVGEGEIPPRDAFYSGMCNYEAEVSIANASLMPQYYTFRMIDGEDVREFRVDSVVPADGGRFKVSGWEPFKIPRDWAFGTGSFELVYNDDGHHAVSNVIPFSDLVARYAMLGESQFVERTDDFVFFSVPVRTQINLLAAGAICEFFVSGWESIYGNIFDSIVEESSGDSNYRVRIKVNARVFSSMYTQTVYMKYAPANGVAKYTGTVQIIWR